MAKDRTLLDMNQEPLGDLMHQDRTYRYGFPNDYLSGRFCDVEMVPVNGTDRVWVVYVRGAWLATMRRVTTTRLGHSHDEYALDGDYENVRGRERWDVYNALCQRFPHMGLGVAPTEGDYKVLQIAFRCSVPVNPPLTPFIRGAVVAEGAFELASDRAQRWRTDGLNYEEGPVWDFASHLVRLHQGAVVTVSRGHDRYEAYLCKTELGHFIFDGAERIRDSHPEIADALDHA